MTVAHCKDACTWWKHRFPWRTNLLQENITHNHLTSFTLARSVEVICMHIYSSFNRSMLKKKKTKETQRSSEMQMRDCWHKLQELFSYIYPPRHVTKTNNSRKTADSKCYQFVMVRLLFWLSNSNIFNKDSLSKTQITETIYCTYYLISNNLQNHLNCFVMLMNRKRTFTLKNQDTAVILIATISPVSHGSRRA